MHARTHAHTHAHTHAFNGPLSWTPRTKGNLLTKGKLLTEQLKLIKASDLKTASMHSFWGICKYCGKYINTTVEQRGKSKRQYTETK